MSNQKGASSAVIVIIILILISCCCISVCGGLGLISMLSEDSVDLHLGDYYNKVEDKIEDIEEKETDNEEDDATDNTIPEGSIQYHNQGWDFSITMPKGWEKYEVSEHEGSAAGFYIAAFEFKLPSTTGESISFFTITIYTPEQWAEVLYGETELITKNGYVYAWSHLNGVPPVDLSDRVNDLDSIRESFEVGTYPGSK